MSLTTEDKAFIASRLDITVDEIPSGQAITSGEGFENFADQTKNAVVDGHLESGITPVGIVDRDVHSFDHETGNIKTVDFTGVIVNEKGWVGLIDGNGLSWFTPNQFNSLKALIALAEKKIAGQ